MNNRQPVFYNKETGNIERYHGNKEPTFSEVDLGGATVTIPDTAYASNAEAVAALGVGKLYKSTTLINGSPIILYTV